jgi:hypothetical protein
MDKSINLSAYPYVERLIAQGYAESLENILSDGAWVTVCDEGGQLIVFDRRGMDTQQVLGKLDGYAKELLEDGIVNDEMNGVRGRLWIL